MKELKDMELTCKNPNCESKFIFPAYPEGKHNEEECADYINQVFQFNTLLPEQQAHSHLNINNLLAYQILGIKYLPNYCPECKTYMKQHNGKLPKRKTLQKTKVIKRK